MFSRLDILAVFLLGVLGNVASQDIVGCGGFVQSSVPIKFEKVEVRLYTKQGSFKLKTECAPNNGYFLAAVYDKGEYTLQISPPAGWGFVPKEISLKIDGVNDACSKGEDLNFLFTGFSVFGKIGSLRREQGPSNVAVKLFAADGKEVAANTTNEVGSFILRNVMPGKYTVKAHHSTWVFRKDEIPLTVENDNVEIEERIEVSGYDVKGHVLSSGEPIQGVSFILYSSDVSKEHMVQSCTDSLVEEILSAKNITDPQQKPLCIAISRQDGSFLFPTVPSGDYMLVPYYSAQSIVFDIVPSSLSFQVNYRSVVLKTPFQVYGFSIQGKIVDSKGNAVNEAVVKASAESGEERLATSKEDGTFFMVNVTTGHYIFRVTKPHYYFGEESIHITPNTPNLKDIVAKEYSLCGSIHAPLIPNGVLQIHQHKVLLQPEGEVNTKIKTSSPNKDGNFCFQVQPGKYKVEVPISESERKVGFLLKPSELHVEVVNTPILDLNFKQFIGAISGDVTCMETCTDVSIHMTPIDQPSSEKVYAKVEVNGNATFTFSNVLPGKYKVGAQRKKWRWEPLSTEVEVKDGDISGISFVHSGYYLKCTISHNITLNFTLENSEEVVGSFELKKGTNQFCLKTPGVYSLTPRSCYRFEKDTYYYNTAMPKSLELNVQFYKLIIELKCSKEVRDLKLAIRSMYTDKEETVAVTKVEGTNSSSIVYEALYWGSLNEEFSVTPQSKEILFYPDNINVTIQENCPGAVAQFDGREGVFIEGSVRPPLADVAVTIVTTPSEKYAQKIIKISTDDLGKYRVGPMHTDIGYVITASKGGYVIKEDGAVGYFVAQKLGNINVMVTDQDGAPMNQVLLSLSGGQYRNNNLTNNRGSLMFANLGPGQYFLRPMQKEYSFEPNSKMINVSEGEEVTVVVKGKRVAFSCSGVLLSLSGIPEKAVNIEAVGIHKCSEYHEGAVSDHNGFFKLRGLQPGCAYNIRMVKSNNTPIERLAPTSQVVNVQYEDIESKNFIVFHKPTKFYITAHIDTELEYLSTLKILIYEEHDMDSPIRSLSPGPVRYIQLPPLKNKTYVIKLQSTLSPKSHETRSVSATVTPDRDLKKKHVKLKFEAKAKKIDMEPTQSVIALPLAVALVFLAYNYDAVLAFVLKMNAFIHSLNKGGENAEGDSDQDDDKQSRKKRR